MPLAFKINESINTYGHVQIIPMHGTNLNHKKQLEAGASVEIPQHLNLHQDQVIQYHPCATVLLYCCDSWVLSKAMESEINAFDTSCYRNMVNIKRIDRVSNTTIYDLTQTVPLVENVTTRQLRFLGHVRRMPDDEPCKEYALYIPSHGKRKPGRQRTLFVSYIQHLLGDTDNMIGPDKLPKLPQDRCGWRKLVVACSTADR